MEKISDDDLKWLLELLDREHLVEIEVAVGESEALVRAFVGCPAPSALGGAIFRPATAQTLPVEPDNLERLLAPMAGIFYRASSPEGTPYAEVGDEVHAGDTIGLIEAMKLYNEVTAHLPGRLVEFLVENEAHVEAEQPLVLIERISH